ncbi:microfibril-associated glycoprotein 4-like [Uranotaenia lowii]|uniref:microfibril-associated glycoprotein 4-like n=1 Tax=Uranotaenia lowii TaxID=190385 RepID=UPI00247A9C8E|nr:microfibril-associated glycoprotein 4-like [Uranotaenia lowii]
MIYFLPALVALASSAVSSAAKDSTGCTGYGFEILSASLESLSNAVVKTDTSIMESYLKIRKNILDMQTRLVESECGKRTALPVSCDQIESRKSGRYLINVSPGLDHPMEVFCDQEFEGGGWLVFQNRFNGAVEFFRGWEEYKNGFGSLEGEFWLGLENIHKITYSDQYELAVVIEDFKGEKAVARYSSFAIGGESLKYNLEKLGTFSGTANDSLTYHKSGSFSTFDRDNDEHESHCASVYLGAWWYRGCHLSNLNARYDPAGSANKIVVWRLWKGDTHRLKKTRMMIRRVRN